jgi:hypothetical protein
MSKLTCGSSVPLDAQVQLEDAQEYLCTQEGDVLFGGSRTLDISKAGIKVSNCGE